MFKIINSLLLVSIVSSYSLASHLGHPVTLDLTTQGKTVNSSQVTVNVTSSLIVDLTENPSTGYCWAVNTQLLHFSEKQAGLQPSLVVSDVTFIPPIQNHPPKMGTSGVKQITFLPQRQQRKIKQSAQIVTVELVWGRSWEVKMVTDQNGHIDWDLVASNGFAINVVELSVTI